MAMRKAEPSCYISIRGAVRAGQYAFGNRFAELECNNGSQAFGDLDSGLLRTGARTLSTTEKAKGTRKLQMLVEW